MSQPQSQPSKWLWLMLPAAAGSLNALGFIEAEQFTAHITGCITRAASSAANADVFSLRSSLTIVSGFVFGAFVSGLYLYLSGVRRVWPLILLQIGCLLVYRQRPPGLWPLWFLATNLGLQNGYCSVLTQNLVRSTHLTGMGTDIALALAILVTQGWRHHPVAQRLKIHSGIVASFALGVWVTTKLYADFPQAAYWFCAVAYAAAFLKRF